MARFFRLIFSLQNSDSSLDPSGWTTNKFVWYISDILNGGLSICFKNIFVIQLLFVYNIYQLLYRKKLCTY